MMGESGQRRFSGQRVQFSHFPGVARQIDRPFPLSVIALFQFAKAWFLLTVVAIARFAPEALRSFAALPALLYFAAHGRDTRGPLLPFVAFYVGLIGLGLWRLWGWARRSLVFSSGVMIVLWALRLLVDWKDGMQTLNTPFAEEMVYFLVFIDVAIVLYLAFHDDVSRAFDEARF